MIDGDTLRLDLTERDGREAAAAALAVVREKDAEFAQALEAKIHEQAVDAAESSDLLRISDAHATHAAQTQAQRLLDALSQDAISPEEAEALAQDALELSGGCGGC